MEFLIWFLPSALSGLWSIDLASLSSRLLLLLLYLLSFLPSYPKIECKHYWALSTQLLSIRRNGGPFTRGCPGALILFTHVHVTFGPLYSSVHQNRMTGPLAHGTIACIWSLDSWCVVLSFFLLLSILSYYRSFPRSVHLNCGLTAVILTDYRCTVPPSLVLELIELYYQRCTLILVALLAGG